MDTTESPNKATTTYADADLNRLLKTAKTLEALGIEESLEYIRIIETGVEELKAFMVKKASDMRMTSSEMARHLGMSRQTFTNRMGHTIEKHQADKKAKPSEFTKHLGETDRFIDGNLTKAAKRLSPASYKDMSTEEKMYFGGFCQMLNMQLSSENTEGIKELFDKALQDGVINPISLGDIEDRTKLFLEGKYDCDEFGDQISTSKAEHEWLRLRELNRICGLTDEQKKQLAKTKIKMMKAQKELDEQMGHINPFAGFELPAPTPAASKLPDNLLEEWEKYQADEKKAGRKPTREKFAEHYGVSRATFSRALKKAEAKQTSQK